MQSSPSDFVPRLRAIAVAVDPTLRTDWVMPVADLDSASRSALRWFAAGIGLAIASVLLLATAGIYALMSFNVTQRRREIGIRSALGAHPHRVLAGVLARAARQLGAGVAVGLLVAALLARTVLADGDLTAGSPVRLIAAVSGLVLAVGLIAAVGPALRGLRVEPTEALRGSWRWRPNRPSTSTNV